MKELEDKIKLTLEKIRPFLISDGGDIEFVKIEDGILYVKMLGACASCHMIDITLKENIEQIITSEFPEIIRVEKIN